MTGRKNILPAHNILLNGDMSTTSLTSAIIPIQWVDNIVVQMVWSGSPVGVFNAEASATYVQDNYGNVTNTGTWDPITLNPPARATGSAGSILLDLNQLSFPYLRIVYTKTSGTGTLNITVGGKML